jgi:hypothetical protein
MHSFEDLASVDDQRQWQHGASDRGQLDQP